MFEMLFLGYFWVLGTVNLITWLFSLINFCWRKMNFDIIMLLLKLKRMNFVQKSQRNMSEQEQKGVFGARTKYSESKFFLNELNKLGKNITLLCTYER